MAGSLLVYMVTMNYLVTSISVKMLEMESGL